MTRRLISQALILVLALGMIVTPGNIMPLAAEDTLAGLPLSDAILDSSLLVDISAAEDDTPDEPTTEVNIFSFNDFHGTVDNSASTSNPGAPRFTAIAKTIMGGVPNATLMAAGDNYQGSAISNYFLGEPVSEMMKLLGVKYSAIGNHDFDWGADKLFKFAADGEIEFLAANLFIKGTNTRPDFCKPYETMVIGGKRIGVVGWTNTGIPTLVKAEYVKDFEFRSNSGTWFVDEVQQWKTQENWDAVIALTHATLTGSNLAGVIDGIVNGHSHSVSTSPTNGVPTVEAGYNGRNLGRLCLIFDNIAGTLQVTSSTYANFTTNTYLPVGTVDAEMQAIYDEYYNKAKPIFDEQVGVFGVNIDNASQMQAWANQLVYDFVARQTGEDDYVIIQNSGGWRSVGYGRTPEEPVDYWFLNTLMPFDNEIYLFQLKGEYLMNFLNARRVTGTGSLGSSPVITNAHRVGSDWYVTSTGEQIDPDKLYKVSMNDFMFTGGDSYGVVANEVQSPPLTQDYAIYDYETLIMGVPLREAMAQQLRFRMTPVVKPPQEGDVEELTVFFTSDLHGAFAGKNFATQAAHAGLSRIAAQFTTRKAALDAAGKAYLTVDVGDTIQGAGTSGFIGNNNFTFPTIAGLNYLGYDVAVLGNHEFNFGVPALLSAYNGAAGTPNVGFLGAKLAGNVFQYSGDVKPPYVGNDAAIGAIPDAERDPLLQGFKAYEIFERNGLKVAIIGMTHPDADKWDAVKLEEAKVYTEGMVGAVKRAIKAIEAEGGADIIIVAGHTSSPNSVLNDAEVASKVHVFLGGHGHSRTTSLVNGVRYAENGANGSSFGEIKITATYENGQWVVKNKNGAGVTATMVQVANNAAEDAGYLASVKPMIDFAEEYASIPIGKLIGGDMVTSNLKGGSSLNAAYFEPTKLVDFINEVQMYYGEAEISGACPFSTSVQLKEGDITRGSLIGIYNYDSNTVYRLAMKGKHVKQWMEYVARTQYTSPNVNTDLSVRFGTSYLTDNFKGINYSIDLTKPANQRVTITSVTRLDGTVEPFDMEETYIVAANDYRSSSRLLDPGAGYISREDLEAEDAPYIIETDCNLGLPIAPDIISLMADYIQNVKGGVIDANDFEKNWEIVPWWETTIENGAYLRQQGEKLTQEGKITYVSSSVSLKAADVIALAPAPITSISICPVALATILRNGRFEFKATLNEGASDEDIIWFVSSPLLVSVSSDGVVVTNTRTGTAILTATDPFSGISASVVLRII
ncbi:MAG: 5'-nucleotidase C-terminal domain-containing protein [Oscillospiraceae bacterium]|nr:5'-nucleotidase C-terminal domain-containing protein [Oscillospiraceae bacterium]